MNIFFRSPQGELGCLHGDGAIIKIGGQFFLQRGVAHAGQARQRGDDEQDDGHDQGNTLLPLGGGVVGNEMCVHDQIVLRKEMT